MHFLNKRTERRLLWAESRRSLGFGYLHIRTVCELMAGLESVFYEKLQNEVFCSVCLGSVLLLCILTVKWEN